MSNADADTRAHMLAYIAAHHTLTLATEQDGRPWASSLFYANDGFTLYFVSDPETQHAKNLKNNPRVAVTIAEDHRDWRAITGLQLEGTCEEIGHPVDAARALAVYATKFSFIGDLLRAPNALGSAMAKARFHRINPRWVRLIDNTRGFGHKEEIHLGAD
jgi:uncharacterized protein